MDEQKREKNGSGVYRPVEMLRMINPGDLVAGVDSSKVQTGMLRLWTGTGAVQCFPAQGHSRSR